jgi:hypothetical protein
MFVQVEKGFFPPEGPDLIRDLCWDAREILTGYMEEGVGLATPDETDEKEEDDENRVHIHDTAPLQVNSHQMAYLSNAPHLIDPDETSSWLLTPGYIALRVEPATDSPVDAKRHEDDRCGQLVFRPTHPSLGEAALYQGYTLTEEARIRPHQTKELRRIQMLLQAMRRGYRQMLAENADANSNTYLSRTPSLSIADQFEDMLKDLHG